MILALGLSNLNQRCKRPRVRIAVEVSRIKLVQYNCIIANAIQSPRLRLNNNFCQVLGHEIVGFDAFLFVQA